MSKFPRPPKLYAGEVSRLVLLSNVIIATIYFSWWLTFSHVDNPWLYGLLFVGELYHIVMVLLFWFTISGIHNTRLKLPRLVFTRTGRNQPSIAVFVTVAGEPVELVKQTVKAVLNTTYINKQIYILNDSYVAKKANWQEYEKLAAELRVGCITRKKPGGAKAGNINNAMRQTQSDLIAIFDADMQPHTDFFLRTVPYFKDQEVGFVQSPQYYKNQHENEISAAAWEQQAFFFGPIMRGKQASNAAFICGTNVVIRRTAVESVGGINETSVAEDFLTSLLIHKAGWRSIYVSDVLAEGLAPTDLFSYFKQQLRWARGSLEVIFKFNPLFVRGLKMGQRLEYLSSTLYYCNGLIVVIDAIIPLIYLLTGASPIHSSTVLFAIYFMPFMFSIIFSLHQVSGHSLTFRAISFTHASWYLQLLALWMAAIGKQIKFAVTSKTTQHGNFLWIAYPHLAYVGLTILCGSVGLYREGLTPSIITNLSWVIFNILLSVPFISAALPKNKPELNESTIKQTGTLVGHAKTI